MSLKGRNASSTTKKSVANASSTREYSETRCKVRPLKRLNAASSSDDSDMEENNKKYGKCMSRNAVIARNNRIKKKNYIHNLEKDVAQYKSECESMKGTVNMQTKMIQTLRNELKYLKNVLANSKEISMLLKTVRDSTGLPVTSSLRPVKEETFIKSEVKPDPDLNCAALPMLDDDDCLIPPVGKELDIADMFPDLDSLDSEPLDTSEYSCNIGVCLHVAQQRVSVEFCSLCNSKAAAAWDSSQSFQA